MDPYNLDKKSKVLLTCLIATEILFLVTLPGVARAYGASDFGLTISQSCTISQTCFVREQTQIGLTARFTISYVPFNGFMESISENVSGVPLASFAMGIFFLSSPTTDTLSIGNLIPDTVYHLTVTAIASDGNSHSLTTTLTTPKTTSSDSNSNGVVGSANGLIPDFNMAITPATQAPKGVMYATYYITYSSIYGFTGPIDEKVLNLHPQFVSFFSRPYAPPYGPSSAYPPDHGRCYAYPYARNSCTDALTVFFTVGSGSTTESLTSGRTYSLVVVGTAEGGFPYHSVTITLTVP